MKYGSKTLAVILILATAGLGCKRSPEFRQDQDYYKPESNYYEHSKSATGKLEAVGQPKKKILVFDFWNDTPVHAQMVGKYAADELKRGLALSRRMIVPKDVHTVLASDDFVNGDKVKVAQLIREGRRLGVAVVVIGRITKVVFRQKGDEIGVFRQKTSLAAADVEVKVFDVAAGREIQATGRSGEASSNSVVTTEDENLQSEAYRAELTQLAIRNAITQLVPDVLKMIEKMVWQGRIAKVSGNKIFVNAGRSSGLVGGDILKVLTPGDDVYDPMTGAYLGRSPGELKGTLEVIDFVGTDGALTEVHTGGNFQEGDVVQLY